MRGVKAGTRTLNQVPDDEIREAVASVDTLLGVLDHLCISHNWRRALKLKITDLGLQTEHFRIRYRQPDGTLNTNLVLVRRTAAEENVGRRYLREALIQLGRPYRCEICNLGSEWNGKPLTLAVDHRDGDRYNHLEDNLRFLCPNCHTQTDTYCSKNIKRKNLSL